MTVLRDFSIRSKLILLASASVAVALVMTCVGLAIHDVGMLRRSQVDQLETQTCMLGFNCTGALTFRDAEAASELLTSLALQPSVELACLYDAENELVAAYPPNRQTEAPGRPPRLLGHRFTESGNLDVCQPVVDEGETVGTIYVRANTEGLYAALIDYAKIVAVVFTLSLAAATVLSLKLQRLISDPIRELAQAAKTITTKNDYSIRVTAKGTSELGDLCDAFNRMLDTIASSKAALEKAHDRLEERVEERTSQLTAEIQRREGIQASLQQAKEEAEAASEAKSQFLANMSHEIRTPLNGILGFTSLLMKGSDIDEMTRREYLQTIHTSGRHLLTLINDILDLSKIEAGRLEIDQTECPPHDILGEVVSVLRVKAQEKGLSLECEWTSSVPKTILTDPGLLRQIVMNLVGNAIKFTEQGTVRIVANVETAARRLIVEVHDTGIGIASDKLQSVFDPFVQADNSATRRYGGTGLGLAICRRLATALGGDVTARSRMDEGSTFSLAIDTGPLDHVEMLPLPSADAVRREKSPAAPSELPSAEVLLVEDGPTNRKLLTVIMEQAGLQVTTAENGQVAVHLASDRPFDVILMDMQMPVMDGYTATGILRNQGFLGPIIALTAHAMKGDEEKCLAAGCSGYLTKPVDPDSLLRNLAQVLEEDRAQTGPHTNADTANESPGPHDDLLVSSLPVEQTVYRQIVEEFADYLQQQVIEMQRAYSHHDMSRLRELAHTVKGSGGTAGFDVLTRPSMELQRLAEEDLYEEIENSLKVLSELSARIARGVHATDDDSASSHCEVHDDDRST